MIVKKNYLKKVKKTNKNQKKKSTDAKLSACAKVYSCKSDPSCNFDTYPLRLTYFETELCKSEYMNSSQNKNNLKT